MSRNRTSYHHDEFTRWHEPTAKGRIARVGEEVQRMLTHLDPQGPRNGTNDTPDRVARMWVEELCAGYGQSPEDVLKTFNNDGYEGMIIQKDVPVVSTCEHHLVPIVGRAWVGYFPNGKVVGLSKITRLVNIFAKRLQIQERLTAQIAGALEEGLDARGVMVVIEAEHLCMTIRGVQAPGTTTITSAVTGLFNSNEEGEKEEFLRLIKK